MFILSVQRWAVIKRFLVRISISIWILRYIVHPTNTICFSLKKNGSTLTKYDWSNTPAFIYENLLSFLFQNFWPKNCLEEIFMSLFHIPFKCIRYSCISSYFSTTHKHAHFVMRPLSSKFKFSLKFAPRGFSLSNCILNWSQLREKMT